MTRFIAAEKIKAGAPVYITRQGMDGDGNRVVFVKMSPKPELPEGDRPRILPDDLRPRGDGQP